MVLGIVEPIRAYEGLTAPVSAAVQQSMVNLFADMGVQPETLQASLVLAQASSDHTSPTAVITSPTGGTSVNQGQTVTITGTASDVGGRVAGIEVSTDSGATWHPAAGTTNWSYTWTASGPGTHVIEARAVDDSVNLQSTPSHAERHVTGSSGPSLFTASNTPAQTNLNDGSAARSRREVPVLRCRHRSPPSSSIAAPATPARTSSTVDERPGPSSPA